MNLDGLNENQKKAVTTTEGPLLVLAGAGSGKTRVLTMRIEYLIEDIGISPYNILAITFTNKAANEMKERVINLVGISAKNMQISTFHSLGVRILRENYDLLGYNDNFVILDSDDSLTVVKSIMKDMNLDIKQINPRAIRNKISSCKNELITPEQFSKFAMSDFDKTVEVIYKRYETKLKNNNSIDFDDLLILPIKLFKENNNILEHYQNKFQYILIDEYQDTNEAQYILTKLLASKNRNICVVGDPDQAIYSFRGANYKNILNFEKDYKDATTIVLEENYRSTKNILDAANQVIKNNESRKEKNLKCMGSDGDKITYYRASDEKDEARFCIDTIKELQKKEVPLSEIAILYRTNAQSRVLEEEFLKSNIPFKVIGSFYFYARKEIKDLLAYLRLIHNDKDNVSLERVINEPKRGIGLKTISNLSEKADNLGISMYEAIDSGKELEFKRLIERLKEEKERSTLTELVEKVLELSGLRNELKSENSLESEIKLENLEEFKSITRTFEEKNGEISLEDFLLEVSLVSDVEEYRNDNNRVSLMTVHSVKGLEFDNVFVVGLEETIFPHMNSMQDKGELEEERRLAYVAITRAKKKLYLLNARQRMIFGNTNLNPVSRFIKEIDENLLEEEGGFKEEKEIVITKKEEMYNSEPVELQVGDYVNHEVFGTGRVTSIKGSLATIAFKMPYGVRTLMKNHKSIKKV